MSFHVVTRAAGSRLVAGLLLALAAAPGAGQAPAAAAVAGCDGRTPPAPPLYVDSFRVAELTGARAPAPWHVTRSSTRARECRAGDGLSLELLPISGLLHSNSRYPSGGNDGLMWAGRGVSLMGRAGVRAAWGPFSAALAPELAWQENRSFEIIPVDRPNRSEYAWYWKNTIDWPQRFGPDSYGTSSWGDSYARVDAVAVAAGFSTERLRWGPVRRYPIMMSGTAPGFPHVFLGTSRPVDIWIGKASLELIWGHLEESDYFDRDADNDTRLLAGLVVALQPAILPGLSLGLARSYVQTVPPDGLGLRGYVQEPYSHLFSNPSNLGEGADNELLALFARWVLPESGFEVYGEVARDDFWEDIDDLAQEPEHAMGIAVGVQKLTDVRPGLTLRVAGEAVDLNFPETGRSGRPETTFYTHAGVQQGYTHLGQLLGAPVGPAGDGQYLAFDLLTDRWQGGLFLERVRYANDVYWQALAPRYNNFGHDVELTAGLRGGATLPLQGLRVAGALSWSGRYNRGWVGLLGPYHRTFDHNLGLQLRLDWTPPPVLPTP